MNTFDSQCHCENDKKEKMYSCALCRRESSLLMERVDRIRDCPLHHEQSNGMWGGILCYVCRECQQGSMNEIFKTH